MIDFGFDFTGRRVLVTGGTRGVGLATAQAFAEAGAQVAVTGTKILPSLYDADLSAYDYHQLQLSSSNAIEGLLDELDDVDVLVNCAAARLPGALDGQEREFVAHSARLGFVGPARLTNRMRRRIAASRIPGGGAVVNTGATRRWFELTQGVSEAQAELVAHTRRTGDSWRRHGARVNSVVEAAGVTVPTQGRPPGAPRAGNVLTRPTSSRAALARDVASVVVFLSSSGAAGISGQTIHVNGAPRRAS